MAGSNITESSTYSANVVGPDAGDKVTAASVRVMGTALACRTKALQDGKILVASGVSLTCLTGGTIQLDAGAALVSNGSAEFNGVGPDKTTIEEASIVDITVTGKATFNGTGADATSIVALEASAIDVEDLIVSQTMTVPAAGILTLQGGTTLEVFGRSRGRSRVALSDVATVTIDTTQAREWTLSGNPVAGGPNVIKLRTTTAPIPLAQERITLIVPDMFTAATGGTKYSIQREDGTVICTFDFVGGGWHASVSAEFVLDGSVWRLGQNSGRSFDGGLVHYGVIPAAGA